MIDVLVVDDSPTARLLMREVLERDPQLRVVATAEDGDDALRQLAAHSPDVITMDITMPGESGIETTRRIMCSAPVPIIIVSSHWHPTETAKTFEVLEAGALSIVEKPRPGAADFERSSRALTELVHSLAEVRPVRRCSAGLSPASAAPAQVPRAIVESVCTQQHPDDTCCQLVAIAASTGGPQALKTILGALPADLNLPVAVVQHITPGFLEGLVRWLCGECALPVVIAQHGQRLAPGTVAFGPEGQHMRILPGGVVELTSEPPVHSVRPSGTVLLHSVAASYGPRAMGIVLSGMGRDGSEGLKALKDAGGLTIAQDKATSIVHGMPGEAIRLQAADHVLPPAAIARTIATCAPRALGEPTPNPKDDTA